MPGMTKDNQPPYKVADREGESWLRNGPDDTYTTYPRRDLPARTYEQLHDTRGPLRPVTAMPGNERKELTEALARAERKAMATLLVALNRTAVMLIDRNGSPAALTAGRSGSWEAADLRALAFDGEGIGSGRVDPSALAAAEKVLERWTTGPTQVELAEGLLNVLEDVANQAGSWSAITDRWLRTNDRLNHWTYGRRLNSAEGVV